MDHFTPRDKITVRSAPAEQQLNRTGSLTKNPIFLSHTTAIRPSEACLSPDILFRCSKNVKNPRADDISARLREFCFIFRYSRNINHNAKWWRLETWFASNTISKYIFIHPDGQEHLALLPYYKNVSSVWWTTYSHRQIIPSARITSELSFSVVIGARMEFSSLLGCKIGQRTWNTSFVWPHFAVGNLPVKTFLTKPLT